MPLVNNLCCGLSLETASKLIGFSNLVIDTVTASLGFISIGNLVHYATSDEDWKEIIEACTLRFYTLVEVFLGIYLLYGIYKRKLHYIRAWVVIQVVLLAVSALSDVLLIVLHFFVFKTEIDTLIIVNVIVTGFHVFSIMVVHSYEVSMRGSQSLYPL
ncbi:uncharacterized protein LOC106666422 [Cimex lectularius]|uniref:Uncharacterized protein n=1 Tax=Cimex lectularius TaxID=79782 RepID=A0A8I6RM81_CIMLE|nr:uncharacterized protein LOC106666422 [Cimex lectularius]